MHYLYLYLATVPIFFAVDMIWLGLIARNFYQSQLGHLLAPSVNWPVAIAFYLLFIGGLIFFAVRPGLEAQSLYTAALYGALFGFFCYATYDLTNWSTVKDWPALLSIVDMLWGATLSAIVASASYLVAVTFLFR